MQMRDRRFLVVDLLHRSSPTAKAAGILSSHISLAMTCLGAISWLPYTLSFIVISAALHDLIFLSYCLDRAPRLALPVFEFGLVADVASSNRRLRHFVAVVGQLEDLSRRLLMNPAYRGFQPVISQFTPSD
ncbi:hypothetical protein OBBRIDRAFT_238219 [Obba rivulosa]|uniref:Uncharacterized protein n=1 Tax=Obba rivulosa TaxID=1052685 RepID=A0A8E2J5S4_9APHY|nr:hypothetical protein OBBRIDRAFT_238219 [Obba rivulosa]